VELVERILGSPIRFLDTANGYSEGGSEKRVGMGIERFGGLPEDFIVATKVDAKDGDYSGDRVRASVEESRSRLRQAFLPLVYLHDPEFHDFETITAPGGAVDALVGLRDAGTIGHIGLAGGAVHEMARYLALDVFEVLLVHNRWTLVDRSANTLIHQALDRGMAVVNAAIYGGGILANPYSGSQNYGYRPARPATLAAIADMAIVCSRWGTDLATAALLSSLRDPLITSTIVGFSKPRRLDGILASLHLHFPDEFWHELESLLPAPENWLDHRAADNANSAHTAKQAADGARSDGGV
jgi:D-threo-aldose 1-dehydrogenase